MADNTNAQAKLVSNEKVRPASDRLLKIYFEMKGLKALYDAQNYVAVFPSADPTGEVIDGAQTDGRRRITNGDVSNVFASLGAFITFMEANTSQHLNRFLAVAVNPQ